ncbi:MAG: hypothetical protein ABI743_06245 [bacterium]
MSDSTKLAILVVLAIACWSLGALWSPFAFPAGQLLMVALWAFAPVYIIVPVTLVTLIVLHQTFGPNAWPVDLTLMLSCLIAAIAGPWWREGRGWFRPLVVTPFLLWLPWLIFRFMVRMSPFDASHLGWIPPGLLSIAIIWFAYLGLRDYQPRKRQYRLSAVGGGLRT